MKQNMKINSDELELISNFTVLRDHFYCSCAFVKYRKKFYIPKASFYGRYKQGPAIGREFKVFESILNMMCKHEKFIYKNSSHKTFFGCFICVSSKIHLNLVN